MDDRVMKVKAKVKKEKNKTPLLNNEQDQSLSPSPVNLGRCFLNKQIHLS